jgi:hypothetical protein
MATMQSRGLDVLRRVALVLLVVSAIVSFGLMLHVGQYRLNILMVLFAVWDLSPFVALFLAGIVSSRWPIPVRAVLYALMLLVAGESVVIYGRVVIKHPAQPAFAFLMVPLVSWVLLIMGLLIAHVVSTKRSGHQPLFRA